MGNTLRSRTGKILACLALYDVLPTQANIRQWKMTEDPACTLCGKIGIFYRILHLCYIALSPQEGIDVDASVQQTRTSH